MDIELHNNSLRGNHTTDEWQDYRCHNGQNSEDDICETQVQVIEHFEWHWENQFRVNLLIYCAS